MSDLAEIKKKVLDYMRHNHYLRGRLEIDFDLLADSVKFKVSTVKKRNEDGREKTITTTETL